MDWPLRRRVGRMIVIACCAAALVALPSASIAVASTNLASSVPYSGFAATNGEVDSMAVHGTTLYIGGRFTAVGPETGSFAAFGVTDPAAGAEGFPVVDGQINAVVPDGAGGWFIGGSFTSVGGIAVTNLAHLSDNQTLDTNFEPNPNQPVTALAISSDHSTLYVGGSFSSIAAQSRSNLAAVSTSDGSLVSAFNPGANAAVNVLTLSPDGSTLYAAGYFTSIGGQSRNLLAGVSTTDGSATGFNPDPNGAVKAIAVSPDNATVYVGGDFGEMDSTDQEILASLAASNGSLNTFDSGLSYPADEVSALAVSSDNSTLYVGGYFSSIGGQTRTNLAALNTSDATATSFNPDSSNEPDALALSSDNSTLYVGGSFTSVGGSNLSNIAAISTSDGTATAWAPNVDGTVVSLAVQGSNLGAGGLFNSTGAVTRDDIAAVDLTTGDVTSWDPEADGPVEALAVSPDGSTVYAGGNFSTIGGQTRNYIAALSAADGTATSFDPEADSGVFALALNSDGSKLYAGGDFGNIGGQSRSDLAALNTADGTATAFDPEPDGDVNALALSPNGSTLYAGGDFSTIGGQSRSYLGAVSTSGTGTATAFHPTATDDVFALALAPDASALYAGWYGHVDGFATSSGTSIFDTTATWAHGSSDVYALALSGDGSTLYVGGDFTMLGGQSTPYLGALSASNGAVTDFNPGADNEVYSLDYASSVYAGGDFTVLGDNAQYGLARFAVPPPVTFSSTPAAGTHSTSASFSFSTNEPGATLDSCKLDGGSFAACTSPKSYSGLAVGSHTFTVKGTFDGLTGMKSYSWSVVSADGSGTLTTPASAVSAAQTGRTLTFTYTAATGGLVNGAVRLIVPSGWTLPQKTSSNGAGYVTASTGTVATSGQTIVVSGVTRSAGQTLTITYKNAKSSTATGSQTWAASERSLTTGSLTALASSPHVTVYGKDGAGSIARTPTSVVHGATGKTVTFTFTYGTGGVNGGAVEIVVPAGWSAPQKTSSAGAGYVHAGSGTVSTNGRTIVVSGLTQAAGNTVTITYTHAKAPATKVGSQVWTTKEMSTAAGLFTAIAVQPAITVG